MNQQNIEKIKIVWDLLEEIHTDLHSMTTEPTSEWIAVRAAQDILERLVLPESGNAEDLARGI